MPETIELIDTAEVRDGQAIVNYSRTEAALATLREKYTGVQYDLTTTAGDKAARAGRLELVTLRANLEKKRKELKAPALEFGKKIDSEAARLTTDILALEEPIDKQITAEGLASLGFPHVATEKASKLYRANDFGLICAAMVAHIEAVQAKQAA